MNPANLKPAIAGAIKSMTIWAGAAMIVLSNIAPELPALLAAAGLHPATVQRVGTVCGVIVLILRSITTQSLTEKGSPPVLPSPVTPEIKP